jgi:hypothetical protein
MLYFLLTCYAVIPLETSIKNNEITDKEATLKLGNAGEIVNKKLKILNFYFF